MQLDAVELHLEARDDVVDVVYVRSQDVHEEVGHGPRHGVVGVRAVGVVHGEQRLEQPLLDHHPALDGAPAAVALVGERRGHPERHLGEERRLRGPEREARDAAHGHGHHGAVRDARGEAERERAPHRPRRAHAEKERARPAAAAAVHDAAVRARGDEREDLLQRERRAEQLDQRLRVVERLRGGAPGLLPRELDVVPRERPRRRRRDVPRRVGEPPLAVEHVRVARHGARREVLADHGRRRPRIREVGSRRLRVRRRLAGAGRGRHWHRNQRVWGEGRNAWEGGTYMLIQTHHEDQNVNISTDGSGLEGLFCKKKSWG
jgi:hypothetical protein